MIHRTRAGRTVIISAHLREFLTEKLNKQKLYRSYFLCYTIGMAERVNLKDYIDLYEKGLKLDRIKPLKNQTYRIFRSSGMDIRIVNRKYTYENSMAYQKIKHFTRNNENFYMVPVTTVKGTIVGFILRGVFKSDYSTISREFDDIEKKVPLMFGFDEKFKSFDKHETCYPIVVCEGSKDCIFMKNFYPYTVAVNTSSMGLNAQVLINLTNKFVLAYDNDTAGQDGIERDKKTLRSLGAQVVSLELDKSRDEDGKFLIKDVSDYLKYPERIIKLKRELKYKLRRVISF